MRTKYLNLAKLIKGIIKKYFESLAYFYSQLGYRIFIILFLSILIGVMDGLGLTMFLPLLKMVNDSSSVDPEGLGKMGFLVEILNGFGLTLDLLTILAIMIFFFIGKGFCLYFAGIYNVYVLNWFIERVRIQNVRSLNSISYKYFVTSDVGRIQNTLTGEVDRVAEAFRSYFIAFQYIILVIVYMSFAFFVNAQFAILVSVGGFLTNLIFQKLYKKTKGASVQLTGESNAFQTLIIQNVSNFKYLRATGTSGEYRKKLEESIFKIKDRNVRIGKLGSILSAAREPLLIIVVAAVISIQILYLGSNLGAILMSLLFFYRALSYLMQMQIRWNRFLGLSGSLSNMTAFGKELRKHKEDRGSNILEDKIEVLELKDVCFSYGEKLIIKNASLEIRKEETIAFVGESGSGKTTLVNLIAGLLPPEKGEYTINSIPSSKLDLTNLQQRVGYITQDPVIFNDTLFNNVTFWSEKTRANEKRFWNAIKQAALFSFIEDLPEKENTVLGNNGVNLSGGQKQRISIARELFKEIEILILDEATSALDSETEKSIQENIDNLKGQYTILIVAHRISTIKNADRIIMMKDGEISNIGNFNELLNKSDYFQRLVELQEI